MLPVAVVIGMVTDDEREREDKGIMLAVYVEQISFSRLTMDGFAYMCVCFTHVRLISHHGGC